MQFRFPPALGAWLTDNLDRGAMPLALFEVMLAQGMPADAAFAIVDAFVRARQQGMAVPVDAVAAGDIAENYIADPLRFHADSRIILADRTVRVAVRGQRPQFAVLNGVLTGDECSELIALARPRLTPSTVVDPQTGQNVVANHRSSMGMFFRLRENPFIAHLDTLFAQIMHCPVEYGEGIQVLHYLPGAESTPHFDFLRPSNSANQHSLLRSGQRISTLVTYLNDVERGGATVFPTAGVAVSPLEGSAIYFEYTNRQGRVDPESLHAGQAVQQGEKWVATKWMRERPFISAS